MRADFASYRVPVLEVSGRAWLLLNHLAQGRDVASRGMNRRTFGVLERYGLVEPDPHNGKPRLSDRGYRLHSVCAGILGDQVKDSPR